MASRNVFPTESKPGVLSGYELYFYGSLGMAEIVTKEGANLHGVAHACSEEEFAAMDKLEALPRTTVQI
jgi:hypothetical protein